MSTAALAKEAGVSKETLYSRYPNKEADFRTLLASTSALTALAATVPAASARGRRSQVREAVTAIAGELANTPTVCRTSYVHETVVIAFEAGELKHIGKHGQSSVETAEILARIVSRPASS